jgi:hypothetical protein
MTVTANTCVVRRSRDMGNSGWTMRDLIAKWKELDRASKKPVGLKPVCSAMGIKSYHVTELLQGQTLTDFKRQHGIRVSPQETPYKPEDLLSEYDRIVSKYRKVPTWQQVRRGCGMPDSTFKKKFGATQLATVEAYRKWLKKRKPHSRNVRIVEEWLNRKGRPDMALVAPPQGSARKSYVSQRTDGRTYGKPIRYENLVYGPANEQGVVLLFAMMSKHLRYNIEGIWGDSFPDCEATRVERGGSIRRVRIEFEYKSKDFVQHGHDAKSCDVIVCWEDNWKDRPSRIEVLELSKEVERIESTRK